MSTTGKRKGSSAKTEAIDRPFEPGVLRAARDLAERYTYIVRHEARDQCFVARPVELPHQIGAGDTAEEAVTEARALTASSIAAMLESGHAAPEPGAGDEPRTEQINFRVSVREKATLEALARRQGLSLVDFIRASSLTANRPQDSGSYRASSPTARTARPAKA